MEIKDFSNDFLDDIMSIEEKSFKKPWTKEMFLSSVSNANTRFKIAFENGKPAGFCIYWTLCGETEILNIAVDPQFRRRSIAAGMLKYMEDDVKNENSRVVFLEVRQSNNAAVNLYFKFGFEKTGVRKKYYAGEDAIVLRKII
ncbi:MAG: ribosomal protein S18-alanine N-acetyltransferase [Endomicrobium sp.]|jgi:ribosomal-protein-alanine N-acetyltransferase|nr:ribosomal protein S18-alanine N-acetyltransferase [Endomicrobium sp.]